MQINATALSAQTVRMNALSSNLANANTTRTPEGGPY
ncbi:MAG: flagellar basal body protein, partial [Desulfovermiculus sp.]